MFSLSRRQWLQKSGIITTGLLLAGGIHSCTRKNPPHILLVSGWQDVNIGDIAHTPGLLHILETHLPLASITLWKKSKSKEVEELLKKNFPNINIIYGDVDQDKNVHDAEIKAAFGKADVMIHGSGPSVVGQSNLEAWVKATDKPFGLFGVTIQHVNDTLKSLLENAAFIYTRETASLEVLKANRLSGNHITFAPDATFYLNLSNEEKANEFLHANQLEEKAFICVIPRLRFTPYHKIKKTDWSDEKILEVEKTNEKHKEKDHAKLREAMIRWVMDTGNKVLVCPEMTYQVDIMDELLIDPLPEDVKPFVLKRGYWLPDEAASVYDKAHSVLSFECHSPIIAAANGTPLIYLRQPEDTIKGQMYYDLGLSEWVFEIEETSGKDIAERLMSLHADYPAAREKLDKTMREVENRYIKGTQRIHDILK